MPTTCCATRSAASATSSTSRDDQRRLPGREDGDERAGQGDDGHGHGRRPGPRQQGPEAAVACPLLEGIDLSGARRAGADRGRTAPTSGSARAANVMNTIRRYAAEDAHVIYGTAYDDTLGDQLRVTQDRHRPQPGEAPAGGAHPGGAQRGCSAPARDNIPVLTTPVQSTPPAHDYTALNTPSGGARPHRGGEGRCAGQPRHGRDRDPGLPAQAGGLIRRAVSGGFTRGAWRAPGRQPGAWCWRSGHTSPHPPGREHELLAAARRAACPAFASVR